MGNRVDIVISAHSSAIHHTGQCYVRPSLLLPVASVVRSANIGESHCNLCVLASVDLEEHDPESMHSGCDPMGGIRFSLS